MKGGDSVDNSKRLAASSRETDEYIMFWILPHLLWSRCSLTEVRMFSYGALASCASVAVLEIGLGLNL